MLRLFRMWAFTGEFQKVRSLCRYYGDKPIEGDLEMDISFGRGPASDAQAIS